MIGLGHPARSKGSDTARDETRSNIRASRASFEDAVKRAGASGYTTGIDIEATLAEFTSIEVEVADTPAEELETLEDKADRLARLRAYVYPPEEIVFEGRSALADLSQWGVPQPILAALSNDTGRYLADTDQKVARGALRSLFGAYDYWAWYVDWYAEFMERVAWYLLGCEALALFVTLNRLVAGDVILGFVFAGVCGAIVSVISKMPPLIADAESNAYVRRIVMRVGTGVAAAVIGGGFIASGIVTVSLPGSSGTMASLLEQCGRDVSVTEAVMARDARGSADGSIFERVLKTLFSYRPAPPCRTTAFLLVLAVGLVLGFSERALTSFEDRLFVPAPAAPK